MPAPNGARVVATVEARMGSSRLPGKTLMDVAGATLLERVAQRLEMASCVDQVVIATTTEAKDDPIEALCRDKDIAVFRGSEDDVLGRVHEAAAAHGAKNRDIVVQSGADCPFYDPHLVDLLVATCVFGGYHYAANDMTLTFPEGVDAHIIRFDALAEAAAEATLDNEREDTPRFLWNHPERYGIFNLEAHPGSVLNRPELRLTVDYPEDMELTRLLYGALAGTPGFSTFDLLRILDANPGWATLNAHCEQLSAAYVPVAD